MSRRQLAGRLVGTLMALAVAGQAHGALTSTTLGNDTPGFNDGDTPPLFPDILNAQSGQPAPFDMGLGNEVLGPDGFANWSFNYAAIVDPILSASLTIGIFDHDSQATGSQIDAFTVEGSSLAGALDTLFEGSGGSDGEYNVYQVTLPASIFTDLADGMASVFLDLQGPGLQTALMTGDVTETSFNGFHLIHSTLSITTQDTPPPPPGNPMPAPGSLALLGAGLLGLGRIARRRR